MEYDADLNYAYSVNRIAKIFGIDPNLLPYIHRLFPSDNARFVMTCGKCGLEVSKEDLHYRHLPDDLHRAWETIEGLLYYE